MIVPKVPLPLSFYCARVGWGNCRMHVGDRSAGQQKRGNSNRYTVRIEIAVTHSKQTTVVLSNRYKKPPSGGVPDLAAVGRSCTAEAIRRGREILRCALHHSVRGCAQDDGRDERPASVPPVFYSTHPGSRIRAMSTKTNGLKFSTRHRLACCAFWRQAEEPAGRPSAMFGTGRRYDGGRAKPTQAGLPVLLGEIHRAESVIGFCWFLWLTWGGSFATIGVCL